MGICRTTRGRELAFATVTQKYKFKTVFPLDFFKMMERFFQDDDWTFIVNRDRTCDKIIVVFHSDRTTGTNTVL